MIIIGCDFHASGWQIISSPFNLLGLSASLEDLDERFVDQVASSFRT
jgi:hypothetical protein